MTLMDEAIESSDDALESHALFEEARRRRRMRWIVGVLGGVLVALGVLAWWLGTGAGGGQPPATPTHPAHVAPLPSPSIPPDAKLVQKRSIDGLRVSIHIYAWPTDFPLAPAGFKWVVGGRGLGWGSSQDWVDPAQASGAGIVWLQGGGGSDSTNHEQDQEYQVPNPSITTVRLLDGRRVLDSMSPVKFDGVRFVILVAWNAPQGHPLTVQGQSASGKVLYSSPF